MKSIVEFMTKGADDKVRKWTFEFAEADAAKRFYAWVQELSNALMPSLYIP
jgi:hypothetical protein